MTPRLIETGDGSHTLRVDALSETYHSHKGAVQESMHVFIERGLHARGGERSQIRVLEVGFGTGLNALLAVLEDTTFAIEYTALETNILPWSLLEKLNYPRVVGRAEARELFRQLHECPWGVRSTIHERFHLLKLHLPVQEFRNPGSADVVFFDAFAAHAQPEMWAATMWTHLFETLDRGGVLVTYAARGQVRRDLQAAGFAVERLAGPPGKREMLRATKP